MNGDNLIPLSERTKEEQREIARMGGKASGRVRRERKAMRETLEIILSQRIPKDATKLRNELKQYGIKDADYSSVLMATLVQKALKGDLKAFEYIYNIMGEDETKQARIGLIEAQTQKITQSDAEIEDISDIEARIYGETDDTL